MAVGAKDEVDPRHSLGEGQIIFIQRMADQNDRVDVLGLAQRVHDLLCCLYTVGKSRARNWSELGLYQPLEVRTCQGKHPYLHPVTYKHCIGFAVVLKEGLLLTVQCVRTQDWVGDLRAAPGEGLSA